MYTCARHSLIEHCRQTSENRGFPMASQGQNERNCTVFRAELRKQRRCRMFRAWLAKPQKNAAPTNAAQQIAAQPREYANAASDALAMLVEVQPWNAETQPWKLWQHLRKCTHSADTLKHNPRSSGNAQQFQKDTLECAHRAPNLNVARVC